MQKSSWFVVFLFSFCPVRVISFACCVFSMLVFMLLCSIYIYMHTYMCIYKLKILWKTCLFYNCWHKLGHWVSRLSIHSTILYQYNLIWKVGLLMNDEFVLWKIRMNHRKVPVDQLRLNFTMRTPDSTIIFYLVRCVCKIGRGKLRRKRTKSFVFVVIHQVNISRHSPVQWSLHTRLDTTISLRWVTFLGLKAYST